MAGAAANTVEAVATRSAEIAARGAILLQLMYDYLHRIPCRAARHFMSNGASRVRAKPFHDGSVARSGKLEPSPADLAMRLEISTRAFPYGKVIVVKGKEGCGGIATGMGLEATRRGVK